MSRKRLQVDFFNQLSRNRGELIVPSHASKPMLRYEQRRRARQAFGRNSLKRPYLPISARHRA
jgi:hypothetical protein